MVAQTHTNHLRFGGVIFSPKNPKRGAGVTSLKFCYGGFRVVIQILNVGVQIHTNGGWEFFSKFQNGGAGMTHFHISTHMQKFPFSRDSLYYLETVLSERVTQKHTGRCRGRDRQTAVGQRLRLDEVQTCAESDRAAGNARRRIHEVEVFLRRRVPGRPVRPTGLRDVLLQLETVEDRQLRSSRPAAHHPWTRDRRNIILLIGLGF